MLLLNDKPVPYFKFPGGELQVRLPQDIIEPIKLTWKPKNSDDIMLLILTCNALTEMELWTYDLEILYFPYARQDRVCTPGEALSCAVIRKLLYFSQPATSTIYDMHSYKVIPEGNPWLKHISVADIFKKYNPFNHLKSTNLLLCAPDEGARHRVEGLLKLNSDLEAVYGTKTRDLNTGEITLLTLDWFDPNKDILVIDDICDGGSTFIQLGKHLKRKSNGKLYLYVTHGIFSKGLGELLEYYDHIYCHHVLDDQKYQSDSNLTIFREFPYAQSAI